MATSAQRRLRPKEIRRFGSGSEHYAVPDLTTIQTASYASFLQKSVSQEKRKDYGLEGVLREIFPIESYDKQVKLEYLRYELGKPRYTPAECRQLRLTYGRPFRVWLRLSKDEPIDEEVYLGDIPIMLGGGTGADVLKRIAAPMVCGLITAMVLSLVIIPAIYTIWKGWRIRRTAE